MLQHSSLTPLGIAIAIAYGNTLADHLHLANNNFDGYFPPQWTQMASLQMLDISNNNIKGEVPKSIFEMNNLKELNLSGNNFFGVIPSELGRLVFTIALKYCILVFLVVAISHVFAFTRFVSFLSF